jgi:hypothetical protein
VADLGKPRPEQIAVKVGDAIYTLGSVSITQMIRTQDMTSAASETLKQVTENQFAVPAREETKRAWLETAKHYGTLGFGVFIVVELAPRLTDPRAVAALGAAALVVYGVISAIKVVKGSD